MMKMFLIALLLPIPAMAAPIESGGHITITAAATVMNLGGATEDGQNIGIDPVSIEDITVQSVEYDSTHGIISEIRSY
jgi:hypothetical protein